MRRTVCKFFLQISFVVRIKVLSLHQILQGKHILGINYNKQKMKQIVKRSMGCVESSNDLSIKELHRNMYVIEKPSAKTSNLTFGTAKKSLLALILLLWPPQVLPFCMLKHKVDKCHR